MRFIFAAITALILGCVAVPQKVELQQWGDVLQGPQSYEGKLVSLCGYFVSAFEQCSLSMEIPPNPGEKGTIWVIPASDICALEKVNETTMKKFAMVRGEFHHSTDPQVGYGHFGMYKFVLYNAHVRIEQAGCPSK